MSPAASIPAILPSVHISTRNPSTYISAGPSSPSSACSSCSCSSCEDSSLPLNTPWSTPPTSPPSSSTSTTARRRRKDISVPIVNMNPTPHSRTVTVSELHAPSPSPPTRSCRSLSSNGRGYNGYHRDRHIDHRRSSSTSKSYTQDITTTTSSSGRTRFSRKLVSKTAAKQLHYPFTTSTDHGGITISTALTQAQIDELIQLTKEIRHNRQKHGEIHRHRHSEHRHHRSNSTSSSKDHEKKAVTFYEKTIVHEVPIVPSTPPSECNDERDGRKESVLLVPASTRHHYSREKRTYYIPSLPRFEPLSPPGPSMPKLSSSSPVEKREVEKSYSGGGDGRYRVKVGRNRRGEVVVVRD